MRLSLVTDSSMVMLFHAVFNQFSASQHQGQHPSASQQTQSRPLWTRHIWTALS
jgi:hypothetical protein